MNYLQFLLSLFLLGGIVGCATTSPDKPNPSKQRATLDRQPMPRLRVQPVYPFELKRVGISGEAEVEFIVDHEGLVREAGVVSATREEFGRAAVDAIYKWQWAPGIKNGRTVSARMRQTFYFAIEDVKGP